MSRYLYLGQCLCLRRKMSWLHHCKQGMKKYTYWQMSSVECMYHPAGNDSLRQRSNSRWIAAAEHCGLDTRTVQRADNDYHHNSVQRQPITVCSRIVIGSAWTWNAAEKNRLNYVQPFIYNRILLASRLQHHLSNTILALSPCLRLMPLMSGGAVKMQQCLLQTSSWHLQLRENENSLP